MTKVEAENKVEIANSSRWKTDVTCPLISSSCDGKCVCYNPAYISGGRTGEDDFFVISGKCINKMFGIN